MLLGRKLAAGVAVDLEVPEAPPRPEAPVEEPPQTTADEPAVVHAGQ